MKNIWNGIKLTRWKITLKNKYRVTKKLKSLRNNGKEIASDSKQTCASNKNWILDGILNIIGEKSSFIASYI